MEQVYSSGQPIVGRRIQIGAGSSGGGTYGYFLPVTTNADGVATIKLPPVRRQVFLVNFLVLCQKVSNMLAFFT